MPDENGNSLLDDEETAEQRAERERKEATFVYIKNPGGAVHQVSQLEGEKLAKRKEWEIVDGPGAADPKPATAEEPKPKLMLDRSKAKYPTAAEALAASGAKVETPTKAEPKSGSLEFIGPKPPKPKKKRARKSKK